VNRAGHAFTGTGELVRLALRRDRVLIPVWVLVFVGLAYSTAASTLGLYPDSASMRAYARGVNGSTAIVAMYGPVWDESSAGSATMYKVSAVGAALLAVLTMIMMVRHTRAEEEAGRLELLGAGVLGRLAGLTAAVVVTAGTTLFTALLTAAGLVGAGLPAAGSVAFGLSWAVTGLAFVGVAAVTAQLTTGARAATGLAAAVLGAAYLLRAVGDASRADGLGWLSWTSPVGWAQQLRPYAGDRWWVFGIGLAFAVATTATGYLLAARRDVGAGLLADQAGRPRATRWLTGPAALSLRLQRGMLLAWTVAFAVLSTVVGSLAGNLRSVLDNQSSIDLVTKLGGMTTLVDAFFAVELGFIAIIASVFAIQSVTRLRAEESALRAEPMLATAIGRRGWALGQLAVTAGGALWLLAVAGTGAGLAASASLHDGSQFGRLLGAELSQAPALLVMIGITTAAFGLAPRFTSAGWAALVGCLLLGELGPLLKLPQWIMNVSPFVHVPRVGSFSATPLVLLTLIGAALVALGVESFRRRDLQP
jgi:polyether ionophore transport system permease protein